MFRRGLTFLAETYARAQATQREHLVAAETDGEANSRQIDWEPITVLITAAFALTYRRYSDLGPSLWQLIQAITPPSIDQSLTRLVEAPENMQLARLADWTFGQTVTYLVAPLLCCLVMRRSPREYALKLRGALKGWPFYLGMYLLILPGILLASQLESFQSSYPFYRLASDEPLWPRFFAWQLLYAWQFLVLEFFFRGFMVHGLKRSCGFYAIFVMTVPYCMIHFGKPPLETIGSIFAGVALGAMSLGTRSIWLGAALHIAVAWTMDAAALWDL